MKGKNLIPLLSQHLSQRVGSEVTKAAGITEVTSSYPGFKWSCQCFVMQLHWKQAGI